MIRILAVTIAIVIFCGTFVTPAFAATVSHAKGSPNALPPDSCLHVGAIIEADGNNEILLTGQTVSTCGQSGTIATVTQQIHVTNGCEGTFGTGPSLLSNTFSVPFNGSNEATYDDKVGCVTCTYVNHVLVGVSHPDFVMFVSVDATGFYKEGTTTIRAQDTGTSTATFTVSNTGLYAPTCPSTD